MNSSVNAGRIAIVGIGLRYPDANGTEQFWQNVLAGRRAFRRIPDERMNHADYYSPDPEAPDRFYSAKAAVLRDFEFDRVRHKIAGSTYRSTDLTHWLALDTVDAALADAGFPDGEGLPKQTTTVVVGNSLTGEFSRANALRLRWPYVRRTVAAALADQDWAEDRTARFLADLEVSYKAPFPPIGEDSLAGGLSNTIAGRICNHFDFGGGGYTVDGACSSSLLSVATAARAIIDGDADLAVAGGVDLSIDPFEVIGFAKTGALATDEMRVYDEHSNGFWPGEGCGMVVLMREADALEAGHRIYATITGWGISSDGRGGITRPEATGHRLAIERAYRRAGYDVGSVSYFEGHGTGTAVGDATEIIALAGARAASESESASRPAVLSSVKGNIGHTKAAAGVAGLIKAALAVHHQMIPPATGHYRPHPQLRAEPAMLRVPASAELWPGDLPIRAGISAMGFGGINTHIALEHAGHDGAGRRDRIDAAAEALVAGRQDAELLLLDAEDLAGLRDLLDGLIRQVPALSYAELADLAADLAGRLAGRPARAAVVAASPEELGRRLIRLRDLLDDGAESAFVPADGIFLGVPARQPRIAFLFPGQGSGAGTAAAIRRRFPETGQLYQSVTLPQDGDPKATEIAQPRIVAGSLAGLTVLGALGIDADVAVGHSLGELTALHWSGCLDAEQVLCLAAVRGRVMASASHGGGAMAGLRCDPATARRFITDDQVVIAGYNGPDQTVVSGPDDAVAAVGAAAAAEGVAVTRINVSHAFHSPLVEPAAVAMGEHLAQVPFGRPERAVLSTVTGEVLDPDTDLAELLRDQIRQPVRFHQAAARAVGDADLVLEVGPGQVLTGLVDRIAPGVHALALDVDSPSLVRLLTAVGAAHTAGVTVRTAELFAGRAVRPLSLDGPMGFLASPCEQAPQLSEDLLSAPEPATADTPSAASTPDAAEVSTVDLLCRLAAERAELPPETVGPNTHPLDDLHLSSITVGQIVNRVTSELGRPPLAATANFATVNFGELAGLIDDLAATEADGPQRGQEAAGVGAWVRAFRVEHVAQPRPAAASGQDGEWVVHAPDGHPLAEPVRAALAGGGVGGGVLLCLPADCEPEHTGLFLAAAKAALATPGSRFVVVHKGFGAAGLARTLYLEAPSVPTTVVEPAEIWPADPAEAARTAALIVAEVAATSGFTEVRLDSLGDRAVPVLTATQLASDGPAESPLTAEDVLLVTGGGRGITAECALAMASDSGARLAILGRADPAQDKELADNLDRMAAAGVTYSYHRADVTRPAEVTAAIAAVQADWGPVTAVLHGAGRNEPAALTSLTEEMFLDTLAPKIGGLRAVLDAVDPEGLKLLVTFGSIIGRAGLRGEAHYATANDWLTELATRFGREHPRTKVLALEWSVWSGAGMGERLGVVEALLRDGITPISVGDGIALLRQLLADPAVEPVQTVSGRFGGLPTLHVSGPELPLARFLDRVIVHYPGVELITEAELSAGSDPYLADHQVDGDLLFPAVIGMEAMAQLAAALTGTDAPPVVEDLELLRPVVVAPGGSTTIRLAALRRDRHTVDVVLRTADTGFAADHFRARLRLPRPEIPGTGEEIDAVLPEVPVDPATELYGGILFQGKYFQRLLGYRTIAARHAVAELAADADAQWFAPFLPQRRVLADPAVRDTVMHAIQCCVPDATLLPQRVERLHLAARPGSEATNLVLDARERECDGDSYVYDVVVRNGSGAVVERWDGLTLRAVRRRNGAGPWVAPMLGPYLERAAERLLGGARAVVVEPDQDRDRAECTRVALSRAVGRPVPVRHRPDGKPEIDGAEVSVSHGAGVTLAIAGQHRLACDVEPVIARDERDWTGLLGDAHAPLRDLLAAECRESADRAATRVWSTLECLRKAGTTADALALRRVEEDGWAVLSAGDTTIATWVTTLEGRPEPVVFAILGMEE